MRKLSRRSKGAKTIIELSAVLGVERTRIGRLRHLPDAPPLMQDGSYDVSAWRKFVEDEDLMAGNDDYESLKCENLRLRNDLAKHDLRAKRGDLLTLTQHLSDFREYYGMVKWVLEAIPTNIALLTTDERLRASVRATCGGLLQEFNRLLQDKEARAAKAEAAAEK